jgi:hypothetical protein
MRHTIALPLIAAALLTGCATGDMADYPSLAQRPIERQANVPPAPVTASVPEPVSATLAEAIRALASDADRGETAFQSALGEARSAGAAGRGAAVGSEAWAQAQLALSRAEAARAPTTLALAELDRLLVVQGDEGNVAGLDAIATEQARVAALVAAQERVLAGLSGG